MPLIIPTKTIGLNDSGIDKAEEFFNLDNLYDIDNVALTHYIDNAFVPTTSCCMISTMW